MAEISVYWEDSVYIEENKLYYFAHIFHLLGSASLYTMLFSNYGTVEFSTCLYRTVILVNSFMFISSLFNNTINSSALYYSQMFSWFHMARDIIDSL